MNRILIYIFCILLSLGSLPANAFSCAKHSNKETKIEKIAADTSVKSHCHEMEHDENAPSKNNNNVNCCDQECASCSQLTAFADISALLQSVERKSNYQSSSQTFTHFILGPPTPPPNI